MEFVVAANRGGYRPTGREINQWRRAPEPKAARKGELLEPEIPAAPERRVRKISPASLTLSPAFSILMASQETYRAAYERLLLGVSTTAFQSIASAVRVPGLFGNVEYEVISGKPGRPAALTPYLNSSARLVERCPHFVGVSGECRRRGA